jgi:isoleucyl-tRNA synthetase
VSDKVDFNAEEQKILKYWDSVSAFETSLKQSEGKPIYTFYDGPPFATGLPHYGHILAGTIKDIVTRYAHQTGHHVVRRFGSVVAGAAMANRTTVRMRGCAARTCM